MAGEAPESKPTPDPTVLTTEQLLREVDRVKELMQAEIKGLSDVSVEKFDSVETQFTLVERQRVEQKKDTKDAVDAALAAAKEAVKEQTTASGLSITKSETATAEQLKQLTVTFTTAINGVTVSFNDLKTRVERIENLKQGGREQLAGIYTVLGIIVALLVIGGVLAASGVFAK